MSVSKQTQHYRVQFRGSHGWQMSAFSDRYKTVGRARRDILNALTRSLVYRVIRVTRTGKQIQVGRSIQPPVQKW